MAKVDIYVARWPWGQYIHEMEILATSLKDAKAIALAHITGHMAHYIRARPLTGSFSDDIEVELLRDKLLRRMLEKGDKVVRVRTIQHGSQEI